MDLRVSGSTEENKRDMLAFDSPYEPARTPVVGNLKSLHYFSDLKAGVFVLTKTTYFNGITQNRTLPVVT
ncbi:hypothetical protein TNCV_2776401 [Trichonephila clavipes]|nr:hypothetical protein TNCV_2776401 [Trichonephila clavipes]